MEKRSNFSSFSQYLLPVVRCPVKTGMRDKIFTPRKAIIRDKRGRDKESRLYILLALDKTSFNPEIFTVFTQFGTTYLLAILLKFEIVHSITC